MHNQNYICNQILYYQNDINNEARIATPGNQYILQLIKGGYLDPFEKGAGKRVLDVGTGGGYNLVTFGLLGYKLFGCDITEEIVAHAKGNIQKFGFKADIRVGENEAIPFPDNYFDFLLSLNSIHYVESFRGMKITLNEFSRVLKPGGRLLGLTTTPDNWILNGARKKSSNVYQVNKPTDFRHGKKFYVFRNKNELSQFLNCGFKDVNIGINTQEYFTKTIRNYVFTGIK